eukprot:2334465-Rhodomonas_salina.1
MNLCRDEEHRVRLRGGGHQRLDDAVLRRRLRGEPADEAVQQRIRDTAGLPPRLQALHRVPQHG